MPTIAELERLTALVQRLVPLSTRAHGDLITAEDWNLLVGAVLEVARAVVSEETTQAVPAHEHPGQVSLGWLDPRLRSLVERGGLSDPVADGRLSGAERAVASARARVDELEASLTRIRGTLTVLDTAELDHRNAIAGLGRRLDGVADPREELSQFRATLDSVRTDLTTVSAFAGGFADVQPEDLLRRLKDADELRERLTTAGGALLDAAEYDRRFTELRATLVTEDELSTAISGVRDPRRFIDELRPAILDETRLAVASAAESAVTEATEGLRGQLVTQGEGLRGDLAAQAEALRGELASQSEALRAQIGTLRDEVTTGIDGVVRDRATELLADRLGPLEGRVTEMLSRIDVVETGVRDLDGRIVTRFDDLDSRLVTRLDALDRTVVERDQTIEQLRLSIPQDVERLVGESRVQLNDELRTQIEEITSAQRTLGTSLRRSIAVERRRLDGIVPPAPPG